MRFKQSSPKKVARDISISEQERLGAERKKERARASPSPSCLASYARFDLPWGNQAQPQPTLEHLQPLPVTVVVWMVVALVLVVEQVEVDCDFVQR
jgi:hypothetical protein